VGRCKLYNFYCGRLQEETPSPSTKAEVEVCKAKVEVYKARVDALEAQIKVCMAAMANSGVEHVSTAPRGNAPRAPAFHEARSTRDIDNFKAYFGANNIKDDAQKVSNDDFSLKDIALAWWCRWCDNIRRGSNPINTWDGLEKELTKQFYPEDAEYEGRAKLLCLQHKDGQVREYVKQFQELLLKMPSMGEH